MSLQEPVRLRDARGVRKLLEVADDRLALLCDAEAVYGVGEVAEHYDESREDVFEVVFPKQFSWELRHARKPLMHVRFGQPTLRAPGFPTEKLQSLLTRILREVSRDQLDRLVAIARIVARAPHGSMLVISRNAEQEAMRLRKQGTRITPVPLAEDLALRLSAIDGAVLTDVDGRCHAFGVILDGAAHHKCTPSRGARYNSAVRYVHNRDDCLAMICSEDGMIDLAPDLRPLIRREDIERRLKELATLAEQDTPELADYHDLMDWFDKHRFYLSVDWCIHIMNLMSMIEPKLDSEGFRRVYREFGPNEEMDETFFWESCEFRGHHT